jgi:hypothetical protein
MNQNESFYVLNIELKNNETTEENKGNSLNLGKETQIAIYDKSGKKLNLSICKNDIIIMKNINDVKELNIKSAMIYSKQGIDVFNAKMISLMIFVMIFQILIKQI